ncbi:MAG: hypothetical protein R3F19_15865 [Verrucomicrobiales bacterium]
MGHYISAIVCKPSANVERLAEFDLPILWMGSYLIVPMDPSHFDDWTERLGLGWGITESKVSIDGPFAHYLAEIVASGNYALIETTYAGGVGDQAAAVYEIGNPAPVFCSERVKRGAINTALRLVGVKADIGLDEFDTLGLGQLRDFEDYFERYYE